MRWFGVLVSRLQWMGGHSYLRWMAKDLKDIEDLSICLFDLSDPEDRKKINHML